MKLNEINSEDKFFHKMQGYDNPEFYKKVLLSVDSANLRAIMHINFAMTEFQTRVKKEFKKYGFMESVSGTWLELKDENSLYTIHFGTTYSCQMSVIEISKNGDDLVQFWVSIDPTEIKDQQP